MEIQVAVAAPVDQLFTYLADQPLALGTRVVVPFGNRKVTGVVWGEAENAEKRERTFALKAITQVIDQDPIYSPAMIQLAQWLSKYYMHPLGEVLKTMLPPIPKNKKAKFEFVNDDLLAFDAERQKIHEAELQLTSEQDKALTKIIDQGLKTDQSKPFLLHGVTGSGKTEIFLRAIDWILKNGEADAQILILVPEISLTPQMTRVFETRFQKGVAVVHSAMTDKERWFQLERIRRGFAKVLVGPRSAVFAPFQNLKLIVVDEEHDGSYKQAHGLTYHGRDVAVVRGKLEKATVLLSSATPAIESIWNVAQGKYHYLELKKRVSAHGMPKVQVVKSSGQSFKPSHLMASVEEEASPFAPEILDELKKNFEDGLQSIVLVNRRGYSHYLYAVNQDKIIECPNCSISMTLHHKRKTLKCHYCDESLEVKKLTTMLPDETFMVIGSGSQRVEAFLQNVMPTARILRLDSDAVQDREVLAKTLESFRQHEIDILVGTQMLAKGHDFPKVSLVAMIEVDQLLGMPDFRGGERTFQLIVQASGRAGRADHAGKVLIQTHRVGHPVIQNAIHNDYENFVRRELEFRKAQGFPPMGKMVLVELNSANAKELERFSDKVAEFVDEFMMKYGDKLGDLKILGPAAAPVEIVRGRVRKQLILFCSNQDVLHKTVQYLQKFMETASSMIRVKYDIDPQSTF